MGGSRRYRSRLSQCSGSSFWRRFPSARKSCTFVAPLLHLAAKVGAGVEPEPGRVLRLIARAVQVVQPVGQAIERVGVGGGSLSRLYTAKQHAGEFATAAALVEETAAITEATGADLPPYSALALAAWQGHEAEATRLIQATLKRVTARGEGMGLSLTLYASAVLHNGLGRYRDALDAAIPPTLLPPLPAVLRPAD